MKRSFFNTVRTTFAVGFAVLGLGAAFTPAMATGNNVTATMSLEDNKLKVWIPQQIVTGGQIVTTPRGEVTVWLQNGPRPRLLHLTPLGAGGGGNTYQADVDGTDFSSVQIGTTWIDASQLGLLCDKNLDLQVNDGCGPH